VSRQFGKEPLDSAARCDQHSEEKAKSMTALKSALEELLRARRLQAEAPPLRGERRLSPLATGLPAIDAALCGGFPRARLSEVTGPASSGRTALALGMIARVTAGGALAACVDPGDHLDPASAAAAGADLARIFWLRGDPRAPRNLETALSATGTLAAAGLFDLVILDLAGAPAAALHRLPGATWIRLARTIEETTTALVVLAREHVAQGPGGVALTLTAGGGRFSGEGPGRLLQGLGCEARVSRHLLRGLVVELPACH
jgi:hypothetical protein